MLRLGLCYKPPSFVFPSASHIQYFFISWEKKCVSKSILRAWGLPLMQKFIVLVIPEKVLRHFSLLGPQQVEGDEEGLIRGL